MPRPIVLSEKIKKQVRKDFAALLDGIKLTDGRLNYSKSFVYDNCEAVLWLSQEAYRKILALVMGFTDEVGWHGTVSRVNDNEFMIEDVFVYPQEVTSSTVVTEQFAYSEWLYGLDDETFTKLRMQGHSHVNMGVSPSGVDNKHRAQILEQLKPDMFYIFMVWNKSLSVHTLIYDMQRNILYEDDDVDIKLLGDDDMAEFLDDAKTKVKKPVNNKTNGTRSNRKGDQLGLSEEFEAYGCYQLCGMCDQLEWEGEHGNIEPVKKL